MQEAGITFDLYLMKINFRGKNRHSGVTSSTILFPWFRGNKHISLNHVILLGIVPERFLYHVPLRVHRGVFWNISDPGGMKAFGVRKLPFVDYLRYKFRGDFGWGSKKRGNCLGLRSGSWNYFYPTKTFFRKSNNLTLFSPPLRHAYNWVLRHPPIPNHSRRGEVNMRVNSREWQS